jgi:hypothetical protein
MSTTTPLRRRLFVLAAIATLTVAAPGGVAARSSAALPPQTATQLITPLSAAPATPLATTLLPEIPAKWPSTHLEVGLTDSPGGAAALHASGAYKFRYQYLSGGVNTGHGWSTWNTGAKFADYYVDESVAQGLTPVFIYYQLLQSSPAGGSESQADLGNLKNTGTMNSYWTDVRLLFQHLGAYSQTIVVDIEPDLWGYIQQASMAATIDDGTSIPAAVASSGFADVAGLPNNAAGFAQAFIKLRDQYAPNVLLGYELSMWGTNTDPLAQNIPLSAIPALAARSTTFQKSLGAKFDLVFTDPADRDAGFDQYVRGDGGASWWDTTDYARFDLYVGDFVNGVGLRMVLWQIPLGNTKMRAMNNTWGHYQDNHVEWWFDDTTGTHLASTVNAGVIAMLFGGGASGTTCACDADGDGVTNPPAINGNNTLSYSADDDGGYFRHQVNAYYAAGAVALPGSAFATSAAVASPTLIQTQSQSITSTVVAAANGTVLVDVQLFGPSGVEVADWSHDNVALTAGNPWSATDHWAVGSSPAAGGYTVKIAVEPAGGGAPLDLNSSAAAFTVRLAGTYVAVDPTRILDTRSGLGLSKRFVSHTPKSFSVAAVAPIPSGAIAVTGNLTVTGQTSAGYVTAGPTVGATPAFSTINFPRGDDRANGVTVALAADGTLAVVFVGSAANSTTHIVFDVTGYFLAGFSAASYFNLPPYRALDTRGNTGLKSSFIAGTPRTFAVGATIPGAAVAVTGNLTVTGQTSGGYVALGPSLTDPPAFSTINFPKGDDRANNVTVRLAAGGTLEAMFVGGSGARTSLVFDVTGYYMSGPGGAAYVPIPPVRTLDTRLGLGLAKPLLHGTIKTFSLASCVPAGAVGVSGNVTVTGQTTSGFVALAPSLTWPTSTSTVNFPKGDDRANGIVVPVDGNLALSAVFSGATSKATTQLVFDLTGYFLPIP